MIRFSPQKEWPVNRGLSEVIKVLQPIKDRYPNLSWADLIVLAGTVANEKAAAASPGTYRFCAGRTDAPHVTGEVHSREESLAPRTYPTEQVAVKDNWAVQGLTTVEGVALAARLRSPERQKQLGYSGSWSSSPNKLSNDYFKVLLGNEWVQQKSAAGQVEYKAKGKEGIYMTPGDVVIKNDPALAAIAKSYASDNSKFLKEYAAAWKKVMDADRFQGPAGNVCDKAVAV
jgi:catalase (peroxidase I)